MSLTSDEKFAQILAEELNLQPHQILATAKLFQDGGTIPFIARYRKEATGSLDEVVIGTIRDRWQQLTDLEARRETIMRSLEDRLLLSEEMTAKLENARTMVELEDIYAPFKPKRRTRATVARERGLEALAEFLMANQGQNADPIAEAANYVDPEKEVEHEQGALAGARDIIAEKVNDHTELRAAVRQIFEQTSLISASVIAGKENEPDAAKFRDYFELSQPLSEIPSHRLLAIRRGEKEGFLNVRIKLPDDRAKRVAGEFFVIADDDCARQVELAVEDACKRLLFNSMESEMKVASRRKADEEAVRVFAENLRELLLASPLGQKRVLALDPGFRTGCKVVCLSAQGQLEHSEVVFPVGSNAQQSEAGTRIRNLVGEFHIEAISIGNGTGSRETENFVRKLGLPESVLIVVVNESGASIYSASEVARREFPNQDVTVRGAVSIGRRLMDPLAELVKIDAKSIGVGQYQHDVDQNKLKASLDDCVVSCVNSVGVNLNTASEELLAYVAGLNATIAANIVAYRDEHGPFKNRAQLKDVPRLGNKAYEQAAGFLRIRKGENPLDASAVHPERYALVEKMAADFGCTVSDLQTDENLRSQINLKNYSDDEVGLPTLRDIREELAKPGHDPRKQFETFRFAEGIEKPSDLQVGMKVPGIVTNVTNFGAFVDVGVHQDALVHISQLADTFVNDPADFVKVNQKVTATVTEVDLDRKRISLSLKANPDFDRKGGKPKGGRSAKEGQIRTGVPLNSGWFDSALGKANG